MKYNPGENNNFQRIRIFGNYFVIKNKNQVKIIYKNKEYKLCEYFDEINKYHNRKDTISLKLRIIENNT